MDDVFYLLNMTISGIKSIKNKVRLDFYKKTIDRSFDPDLYRIKAIYGENGAGKSAIITAVKVFQEVFLNDNYLNESKNQNFLSEIVNKETKKFTFCCEYMVGADENREIYNYSITLGKNSLGLFEIQYENLKIKNGNYPNNNYQNIFECINGELNKINVDEQDKELITRKTMNLLSAHPMAYLFITGIKRDNFAHNKKISEMMIRILYCLLFVMQIKIYLDEEDQHELYFLKKIIRENGFDKQSINGNEYDIISKTESILNINEKRVAKISFQKYKEKIEQLTGFVRIFKKDLLSIDIDAKEDGEQYICELILNYGNHRVNKEFESTGIKKLIRLFDCFLAASHDGIVFIDEMDSNLNDVYLCKLIEYFMYYGKGQLCFTTHNLDPMVVLKNNKNSIDFLSSDNNLVSWVSRGNSSPDNFYRNGMIEDLPFNVDATDFIGILGE